MRKNILSSNTKNITADAGYESEENYIFLEENNQTAFIKPANYEISKTRKYKNDIGKIENIKYDRGMIFIPAGIIKSWWLIILSTVKARQDM